jgi:DNA-binding response OmpR family regulator
MMLMNMQQTIMIVAGDEMLTRILGDALSDDAETGIVFNATAAEALVALEDGGIDLILLSDDPPDMTVPQLWCECRRIGHEMPVVVMTMDAELLDVPDDESEDAWDAVVCPVRLNTLIAVLKANLSPDGAGARPLSIGPYHLDVDGKSIGDPKAGVSVRLTEKEAAILQFLRHRAGAPVGRDTLLGEVWGYNQGVTTHTLETHIYRLRRKLEALGPEGPGLVHTEPGGYRVNLGISPSEVAR